MLFTGQIRQVHGNRLLPLSEWDGYLHVGRQFPFRTTRPLVELPCLDFLKKLQHFARALNCVLLTMSRGNQKQPVYHKPYTRHYCTNVSVNGRGGLAMRFGRVPHTSHRRFLIGISPFCVHAFASPRCFHFTWLRGEGGECD